MAEQRRGVDFESIWRRQAPGPRLTETVASLAKQVQDVVVDPPTGISNVTEWAKKEGCWDRVRMLNVELPPVLREELMSSEEQQDAVRAARRDQRQLSGIEAQIAVVNAGSEFWEDALRWGRLRELLTPAECGVLEVAARMPQRTPTEKQSTKAVEVLGKLRTEGYEAALGTSS